MYIIPDIFTSTHPALLLNNNFTAIFVMGVSLTR